VELSQTTQLSLHKTAGVLLEPSARIYALWEHENRYVDSLGTLQAVNNFTTGRVLRWRQGNLSIRLDG
jgi:hypothetical protein